MFKGIDHAQSVLKHEERHSCQRYDLHFSCAQHVLLASTELRLTLPQIEVSSSILGLGDPCLIIDAVSLNALLLVRDLDIFGSRLRQSIELEEAYPLRIKDWSSRNSYGRAGAQHSYSLLSHLSQYSHCRGGLRCMRLPRFDRYLATLAEGSRRIFCSLTPLCSRCLPGDQSVGEFQVLCAQFRNLPAYNLGALAAYTVVVIAARDFG